MKYSEYSVVIVGSGAAGLYAALKISQQINLPDGILLVTKSFLGDSNSMYAQGGIVGVLHQNPDDAVEKHVVDTLNAGAGLSERDSVQYISEASDEVINDLMDNGVNFDRNESGSLTFTLEAAHSVRRILHSGGDATGRGITQALCDDVRNNENIVVMEDAIAAELLVDSDNECKGVIVYNELTGEHEIVYTSALVLATGGLGQLYKYTTNPECATGDGIDLAYNAGAIIQDMEFVQFHPTALALDPNSKDRFLISEAVRGEGARLVNNHGDEFMSKYHDRRELAPRDVVTRAIYSEMKQERKFNVFLNASMIDSLKLLKRFPTISKRCSEKGIDISLHGANRLASNSLLECVVCAYELADYLSFANLTTPKKIDDSIRKIIDIYSQPISETDYNINELKSKLKEIMWNNVGIIRSQESLEDAKNKINLLKNGFKRRRKCLNRDEYEYRNMLTAASLIVESALERKESRGAHCRSDYPQTDSIAKHSNMIKNSEKELVYVK